MRNPTTDCGKAVMPLRMTQVDRQLAFDLFCEAIVYGRTTPNPDIAMFAAEQVRAFNLMVEGEERHDD